jgi:4-amino-4-deoxy-L-arabinose transferase-like glycosyltransferase
MKTNRTTIIFSDLGILIFLALARLAVHMLTDGQYGFHRDELAVLDEAQHLAWGYVAYPPLTPFIGRMALELFGLSPVSVRFFSALAQCVAMVFTGLMARELGGQRGAQMVVALSAAISPISLIQGALFQYVSFDYLWWVLSVYFVIRLLKSEDARWWLAIGAVIGLGMMTKTTMAFWVAGIVGGVLLTSARRYLKSPWLWGGFALALLIFLPNLIWQWQHDFVSLKFLASIHTRDVRIGRAEGFFEQQPIINANPFTLPLWLAGLYFFFFAPGGARYRLLGWMYLIPLVLLFLVQARSYYLAPAYPMLLAAGAVAGEHWLSALTPRLNRLGRRLTWSALTTGAVLGGALMLPVAPVNSSLWKIALELHDNFAEQIGWPELVKTVSDIYAALPAEERQHTGILAGNYGEAGAINLFGPAYNLPPAISGVNTYWWRGYGDPPPQTLIVLGFSREATGQFFISCELAGHITNRYGIENEETRGAPDIFVCRRLRKTWPEFWRDVQSFG